MKALIAILLLLSVVSVSAAQVNNGSANEVNALTSEESRFVFGDAHQANAVVPLSDNEMASTKGNSICIYVWNGGKLYVYCDPPYNISYSGH